MNVVVGGGLLGSALVRALGSAGAPVRVLSRTPREHRALWSRFDLATGRWPSLPVDARVFVCIQAAPDEKPPWTALAQALPALSVASVTLCAPAGDPDVALAEPFARVVLRFSPLFGPDAAWLTPALTALRQGSTVRIPKELPELWPLHADDAARATLLAETSAVVKGPARVNLERLLQKLAPEKKARLGRPLWPFGYGDLRRRLGAQAGLADGWAQEWGTRQDFEAWIRAHS